MGDLEKFLHAQDLFVHPLVRIAIAHYQFETVHPFLDGNGRLGRLMISLYLAAEKLLSQPALYLSDYFERNKTSYVDHLMGVRDGNHLRAWLVFFLHGIEETARASAGVFKSILSLKQRIDTDVMPHFTAKRQINAQTLMRELYGHPVIDVKWATRVLDSSTNTAAAMINDFITHGVLVEITGQKRNRFFIFQEYVSIFKS